ncbi:uncharacterized protein TNCV_2982221 [Trichonephila clavipes]|nr:uncharacterized protein TNCV_2982221 [Trichonephila clavipes]
MGACKCIVPWGRVHGGTLNSRRVASLLVLLVEGEERWEAPGHPQGFLPLNSGETEQNRNAGVKIIALSHDEYRGPRSDFVRQGSSLKYRDDILEPCMRHFRGTVGPQFIFGVNNCHLHRAQLTDECIETDDIQRIVWSAGSPDLNCIDYVSDVLEKAITKIPDIINALVEEVAASQRTCTLKLIPSHVGIFVNNLAKEARNSPQLSNRHTLTFTDAIARRKLTSHPVKKHFIPDLNWNGVVSTTIKPKSIVSDVIVKWKRRGSETAEKRTGRPKILGECSRRTLKRAAKQNRKSSLVEISQEFQTAHQPSIPPQNAKHPLQWCRAHHHWTVDMWKTVLWSDEARFTVWQWDGRVWVSRMPGERFFKLCPLLSWVEA